MILKLKLKQWFYQDMPESASMEDWDIWTGKAKLNKLRWFISDTIPTWWYSVAVFPYNKFTDYFRYRLVPWHRYHMMATGQKPGYSDVSERLLYVNMNALKDFVEIEKAWMQVTWSDNENRYFFKRWFFREPEKGLEYLRWEANLTEKESGLNQASTAETIMELYSWWINVRPNRVDPYEESGWYALCKTDKYHRNTKETTKALDECTRIEKEQEDEDTEMLIKLIKIREGLWT